MRKLASVRRISEISPIENADSIELATVDGWNVVVKKGEFLVGDLAIYFEIDSWVPHSIAPFLSKGHPPREFEGIPGARLRTVKLRGALSQGLLVKPQQFFLNGNLFWEVGDFYLPAANEGDDLTQTLFVKKWEPELAPSLSAEFAGEFPSYIPKTEQERVQNVFRKIDTSLFYEVTEKLDGTSCTMFVDDEENLRVCSRNRELRLTSTESIYVKKAREMEETLRKLPKGAVLQGEIFGKRIQRGYPSLKEPTFAVFDIWNTKQQRYLSPLERRALCIANNIPHVPILEVHYSGPFDLSSLLEFAEGESVYGGKREGLVFKSENFSFKAISNSWLLKEK